MTLKPALDPFPTTEVFRMGDECLDDHYRELAATLFGETEELMKVRVREFRDALKKEGINVPDYDHLNRKFLRSGGLDVEASVAVLKNYLRAFSVAPHYFDYVLPHCKTQKAFESQVETVLPHRDKHGRRVYIYRSGKWNPDDVSYGEIHSMGFKIVEVMALEPKTQVAGVTILVDGKGYGMKQFAGMSIADVKLMMMSMERGFPLWFRTLHIVNAPKLLKVMSNLAMPFLSARMRESVYVHSSLKDLHEHVDPEILPEEFGGSAGAFDNAPIKECVERFGDYFQEVLDVMNRSRQKTTSEKS